MLLFFRSANILKLFLLVAFIFKQKMSFKILLNFKILLMVGKLQLVHLAGDLIVMTSPVPCVINNRAFHVHCILYLLVNISYCSQINCVAKFLVPLV